MLEVFIAYSDSKRITLSQFAESAMAGEIRRRCKEKKKWIKALELAEEAALDSLVDRLKERRKI